MSAELLSPNDRAQYESEEQKALRSLVDIPGGARGLLSTFEARPVGATQAELVNDAAVIMKQLSALLRATEALGKPTTRALDLFAVFINSVYIQEGVQAGLAFGEFAEYAWTRVVFDWLLQSADASPMKLEVTKLIKVRLDALAAAHAWPEVGAANTAYTNERLPQLKTRQKIDELAVLQSVDAAATALGQPSLTNIFENPLAAKTLEDLWAAVSPSVTVAGTAVVDFTTKRTAIEAVMNRRDTASMFVLDKDERDELTRHLTSNRTELSKYQRDLSNSENLTAFHEYSKVSRIIELLLQEWAQTRGDEELATGGPLLSPDTHGVDPAVYSDTIMFRQRIAVAIQQVESIVALNAGSTEPINSKDVSFLEQVKAMILTELEKVRQPEVLPPGVLPPALDANRRAYGRELLKYFDWIDRVIVRFAAVTGVSSEYAPIFRGEPQGDDHSGWSLFFENLDMNIPIAVLRHRYNDKLNRELMGMSMNKTRNQMRGSTSYHRYHQLMLYLNKRGDKVSVDYSNEISNRITLFDMMNPYARTADLASAIELVVEESAGNDFSITSLAYFINRNRNGLNTEPNKNHEHADLIVDMIQTTREWLHELPDPDLNDKNKSSGKRDSTEAAQTWGAGVTTVTLTDDAGATHVVDIPIPSYRQGQLKGKYIHGTLNVLGKWTTSNDDSRDLLMERLLDTFDAAMTAKGLPAGNDFVSERWILVRTAVEYMATMNLRGVELIIPLSGGASPPGATGDASVPGETKQCPIFQWMSKGAKQITLIPEIARGMDIPDEYIEQLEYIFQCFVDVNPVKLGKNDNMSRLQVLKHSIAASRLVYRIYRGATHMPPQGLHLVDWNGKHVVGPALSSANPLLPGQSMLDHLRYLPKTYQSFLPYLLSDDSNAMVNTRGYTDAYLKTSKALTELTHLIEAQPKYETDPTTLKKEMKKAIDKWFNKISPIKAMPGPLNYLAVGELFETGLQALVLYYKSCGHNPWGDRSAGSVRRDLMTQVGGVFARVAEFEERRVVSKENPEQHQCLNDIIRNTIDNQELLSASWGGRIFDDPFGGAAKVTMRERFVRLFTDDPRVEWFNNPLSGPERYLNSKSQAASDELYRLYDSQHGVYPAQFFNDSYDKKSLARVTIDPEKAEDKPKSH